MTTIHEFEVEIAGVRYGPFQTLTEAGAFAARKYPASATIHEFCGRLVATEEVTAEEYKAASHHRAQSPTRV